MRNGNVARRGIASLFMRRETGWAETGVGTLTLGTVCIVKVRV